MDLDWTFVETQLIPIEKLEIGMHNLYPEYLYTRDDRYDPIEVIHAHDRYLIHDGRHRVLTRWLKGGSEVLARVLRT